MHVISFVPGRIPYLGKFWFVSFEPKQILFVLANQDCKIHKTAIFQEKKLMDQLYVWHADADIDSRNKKCCIKLARHVLKSSANQISGFLNQIFRILKNNLFNQRIQSA